MLMMMTRAQVTCRSVLSQMAQQVKALQILSKGLHILEQTRSEVHFDWTHQQDCPQAMSFQTLDLVVIDVIETDMTFNGE